MSRYRNVVGFAFVAAAMAPALALHGSQQAGDAPAPAPARRAIGEDDCNAAKLGSEISVEAISERVSAVTLSAPQWPAGTANSPAYCSIEGSMAPFDQRSTARPIRFGMALPASWSRRGAQLGGAGMNGSIPMLTGGIGRGRPTLLAQGFATYGGDYGIVGLEEYDAALYKQLSTRPTAAK